MWWFLLMSSLISALISVMASARAVTIALDQPHAFIVGNCTEIIAGDDA
jgi:hypothetical protein